MDLYIITEIFTNSKGISYTTTNNHIKDKDEALNMFLTRTQMMKLTPGSTVLEQTFLPEGYGFTKVKMVDGSTIEIGISKAELL